MCKERKYRFPKAAYTHFSQKKKPHPTNPTNSRQKQPISDYFVISGKVPTPKGGGVRASTLGIWSAAAGAAPGGGVRTTPPAPLGAHRGVARERGGACGGGPNRGRADGAIATAPHLRLDCSSAMSSLKHTLKYDVNLWVLTFVKLRDDQITLNPVFDCQMLQPTIN